MAEGSVVLFTILAALVCRASSLTGTFWHVTDFHYDYRPSCNNGGSQLGDLGDCGCGSPWKVVNDVIKAMNKTEPNVDFLLWTGDSVACISDNNPSVVIDVIQNITNALTNVFPNKKVYATLGNRDYWPPNQFPGKTDQFYHNIANIWNYWIPADQLNNFTNGGYYTAEVTRGLRIIALNTNLYYTSNYVTENCNNEADPAGQLKWMKNVLWDAKESKEKVLITAHIGPGVYPRRRVVWFQDKFVERFNDLIKMFANIIVGMHFGHDHHDGFKIFFNKKDTPEVPMFLAPAVSPCRYTLKDGSIGPSHDPAVRLVRYNTSTFDHRDVEQYRLDQTGVPSLTLLYQFTELYDVEDLTGESLDDLVEKMESESESHKFLDDYIRFTEEGAKQTDISWCNTTCRYNFLCGFRYHTLEEFDLCVSMYTPSHTSTSDVPSVYNSAVVGLLALTMISLIMAI